MDTPIIGICIHIEERVSSPHSNINSILYLFYVVVMEKGNGERERLKI